MTDSQRHSVSVAGVVISPEGKILVISAETMATGSHRGGVLELAETIEEGLRREILEETGIEVSIGPLIGRST